MEQAGAPPEEQVSWEDGEFYDLSVNVSKSQRYHSAMSEFYTRGHDLALAATAVTGSGAFIALLPDNPNTLVPKILTAVVATATTIDLVFNPSKKADIHSDLHKRFTRLAAKIRMSPAEISVYREVFADRLAIEADEPPVRRIIDIRAQNDECRSRGVPLNLLIPLGPIQRSWLGYVFTFGMTGVEKKLLKRQHE